MKEYFNNYRIIDMKSIGLRRGIVKEMINLIPMERVLDYLLKNEYENIYMIRALNQRIKDFTYEAALNDIGDIIGFVGIWKDDRIATLRGDKAFCRGKFHQLYGTYDFFDLEDTLVDDFITENDINPAKDFISHYDIMEIDPKGLNIGEDEILHYTKVDKNEWHKIGEKYREKYGIEFTEFQPDNMDWVTFYEGEKAISNICIEKTHNGILILSNFYTIPDMRSYGIGSRLMKSVIANNKDLKLILFVNRKNTKAIRLYKKLGIKVVGSVVNIQGYKGDR